MDTSHLKIVLSQTFAANFVAYYRTHVAHVNTTGRTFYQDHKLLQKIYEYLQDNIDTLAEKLRTVQAIMPPDLNTVCNLSNIIDSPTMGSSVQLLEMVEEDLEALIDQYKELYTSAEEVEYIDISNFAQDQVGQIARFRWMLQSTLDERSEE